MDFTLADNFLLEMANALSFDPAADVPAETWDEWATYFFPRIAHAEFGDHHAALWEWAWGLKRGKTPRPFVAIWPRGGAKSSTAEMVTAMLGATGRRKYVLYVRSSQEQANGSVQNIAALLQSSLFTKHYPDVSKPMVNQFGQRRSWKQQRLITAAGFTVDAYGMDAALRGVKVDEMRPDLIILDDIDEKHDSPGAIKKKIATITTSILPAGASDCAVLAVQNLIRDDGFFGKIADGSADYLMNRILSGPIPAIYGLQYEERFDEVSENFVYKIVGGTPAWAGQSIKIAEEQMTQWGLAAFLIEAQHEVDYNVGGTYEGVEFRHVDLHDCPHFTKIVCWVDPAVTDSDESDAQGIQIDALGTDKKIYRLYSLEQRGSPKRILEMAIKKAAEYGAQEIGIETDQGGDLWRDMYDRIITELRANEVIDPDFKPRYAYAKAGSVGSKRHRQDIMRAGYDRDEFRHVRGTHVTLESALKRFPHRKPYDLADASYWAYHSLRRNMGWVRGAAE